MVTARNDDDNISTSGTGLQRPAAPRVAQTLRRRRRRRPSLSPRSPASAAVSVYGRNTRTAINLNRQTWNAPRVTNDNNINVQMK